METCEDETPQRKDFNPTPVSGPNQLKRHGDFSENDASKDKDDQGMMPVRKSKRLQIKAQAKSSAKSLPKISEKPTATTSAGDMGHKIDVAEVPSGGLQRKKKVKKGPATRTRAQEKVKAAQKNLQKNRDKSSQVNSVLNNFEINLALGRMKIEADGLRPFPKVEPIEQDAYEFDEDGGHENYIHFPPCLEFNEGDGVDIDIKIETENCNVYEVEGIQNGTKDQASTGPSDDGNKIFDVSDIETDYFLQEEDVPAPVYTSKNTKDPPGRPSSGGPSRGPSLGGPPGGPLSEGAKAYGYFLSSFNNEEARIETKPKIFTNLLIHQTRVKTASQGQDQETITLRIEPDPKLTALVSYYNNIKKPTKQQQEDILKFNAKGLDFLCGLNLSMIKQVQTTLMHPKRRIVDPKEIDENLLEKFLEITKGGIPGPAFDIPTNTELQYYQADPANPQSRRYKITRIRKSKEKIPPSLTNKDDLDVERERVIIQDNGMLEPGLETTASTAFNEVFGKEPNIRSD